MNSRSPAGSVSSQRKGAPRFRAPPAARRHRRPRRIFRRAAHPGRRRAAARCRTTPGPADSTPQRPACRLASASPLMQARPTRTPVNEPGPDAAAKQSISARLHPVASSSCRQMRIDHVRETRGRVQRDFSPVRRRAAGPGCRIRGWYRPPESGGFTASSPHRRYPPRTLCRWRSCRRGADASRPGKLRPGRAEQLERRPSGWWPARDSPGPGPRHFAGPQPHHGSRVARVSRVILAENARLGDREVARGLLDVERHLGGVGLHFCSVQQRHRSSRDSNLYERFMLSGPSRTTCSTQSCERSGGSPVKWSPLNFFFTATASPSAGFDPEDVVGVLLHHQFDRPGLLDVDHVLDVFERQGAAAIHVEIRLQFPVARAVNRNRTRRSWPAPGNRRIARRSRCWRR